MVNAFVLVVDFSQRVKMCVLYKSALFRGDMSEICNIRPSLGTSYVIALFFTPLVAGRCIPTIFDLDSIIDEALYLEGNETIDPDLENDVSFSLDTVTLGDIRDGTLYA